MQYRRMHRGSESTGTSLPSTGWPSRGRPCSSFRALEIPMLTRTSLTIRLHPNDDVVIARSQLVGGTNLLDEKITVVGLVPPAHKIATRAIKKGDPVKRYNQIIGFASRDIAPGEHVHLNNLVMGT